MGYLGWLAKTDEFGTYVWGGREPGLAWPQAWGSGRRCCFAEVCVPGIAVLGGEVCC